MSSPAGQMATTSGGPKCTLFRWRGARRPSAGEQQGQAKRCPAVFVRERYEAGWSRLSLTVGDVEIGGIGPHPDTGRRTWWAEACDEGMRR